MVNLQIEHTADGASKAVTYLRSKLDNVDQLINKKSRYVSCPKVPPILRNDERSKEYFDPKIVSFGPYHHGKPELRAVETIKTKVILEFILKHEKSIEDLYLKVLELNDYAKSCYVDGSTDAYDNDDEAFALMMLQDSCFILALFEYEAFVSKYLDIFQYRYALLDTILLENQIPFRVLNVLMSNIYKENEGLTMIKSYLYRTHWGNFQKEDTRDEKEEEPHHLLGLLKTLISKRSDHVGTVAENVETVAKNVGFGMDLTHYLQSFGSVTDLQAKGINFKPSNSICLHSAKNEKPKSISLRDVEFRSGFFTGELKLPLLVLSSDSEGYYKNLIASEMCAHTDFTVASYITFMNSLIANPEDVKVLRSKHIILHTRRSDEEVFKMLKEISAINWVQDFSIYQGVREKIEKHHNNKIKILIAEVRHKYFSHSWSAIGLLAAIVAIFLSFLQTFYTIYSRKC